VAQRRAASASRSPTPTRTRAALAELEQRIAERATAFTALLDVSRGLASTLELHPLLELVLDSIGVIVPYTDAMILLLEGEGEELCVAVHRSKLGPTRTMGTHHPVAGAVIFQAVLAERGPVIVDDLLGPTPLARRYRDGDGPKDPRLPNIRSMLSVPLRVKGRIIGYLRLDHTEPGFYTRQHAELAGAFANHAAVAIEAAHLFEQGERRRRELEALYHAEEALHRSLEPQAVLDALVEAATDILGADKTSVLLWDAARERLQVQAARGFEPAALARMSYRAGEGVSTIAALRDEIVEVTDAQHDERISAPIRAINAAEGVRSLISVPITAGGQTFGVFNLHNFRQRTFNRDERRLLLALAQRAALALQNARLFEGERSARERLEVAVAAGRMGTWEWDTRTNRVTWSAQLEAIHGLAPGTFDGTFDGYLRDVHPEDRERVEQIIAASLAGGEHHLEYRIIWPDGSIHWLEASGRLARDASGQPIGMRGVCQDVTARKAQELERARLVEGEKAASKARAALEERQRLARELHDSVSQALYGIALGSQTALAALREDHDLAAGAQATQYVLSLAEAALAEMRALIFELRPESLQQEGLVGALERHAASLRARHALEVEAQLGTEPALPLETKEALYRIAQEGMHNAVKHAHATRLQLRLEQRDGAVCLEVADEGVGFDAGRAYPGHLGLVSMRERAAAAGAELRIDSAPGRGTRVIVELPT
jgi:PAS domain S-box-containing protein